MVETGMIVRGVVVTIERGGSERGGTDNREGGSNNREGL